MLYLHGFCYFEFIKRSWCFSNICIICIAAIKIAIRHRILPDKKCYMSSTYISKAGHFVLHSIIEYHMWKILYPKIFVKYVFVICICHKYHKNTIEISSILKCTSMDIFKLMC